MDYIEQNCERAYEKAIEKIDEGIATLQQQIENRRDINSSDMLWGQVGDLNHIVEILKLATEFLGA